MYNDEKSPDLKIRETPKKRSKEPVRSSVEFMLQIWPAKYFGNIPKVDT